MKSIKQFVVEQSLLIIVFFIGVIFGSILPVINSIEVDSKINISDLVSTGVTIVLGVYLGTIIVGQQSSNRFEKEFLISEARKLTTFIDSKTVFSDTRTIPLHDITAGFKELNIHLKNFENMIPIAEHCNEIDTARLRESFKEYRESITNLPSVNRTISPTIVQRDIIVKKNFAFKAEVFKVITKINSQK